MVKKYIKPIVISVVTVLCGVGFAAQPAAQVHPSIPKVLLPEAQLGPVMLAPGHMQKPKHRDQSKDKNSLADEVLMVMEAKPTFDVVLKANATTGYRWSLMQYDHQVLKLVSYQYHPDAHPKGYVGVGGEAQFTFVALPAFFTAPQQARLRFKYHQPWQKTGGTYHKVTVVISGPTAIKKPLTKIQPNPKLLAEDIPTGAIVSQDPDVVVDAADTRLGVMQKSSTVSHPVADAQLDQAPSQLTQSPPVISAPQADTFKQVPVQKTTLDTHDKNYWLQLPQSKQK